MPLLPRVLIQRALNDDDIAAIVAARPDMAGAPILELARGRDVYAPGGMSTAAGIPYASLTTDPPICIDIDLNPAPRASQLAEGEPRRRRDKKEKRRRARQRRRRRRR